MTDDSTPWFAILVLAATVFALRYSGLAIMSYVRITPRIELFLEKMSTSVLVALVATSILSDGLRTAVAVSLGLAMMFLVRSPIAAMMVGIAAAASWRALPL